MSPNTVSRRFVPQAVIAKAARGAPRVDVHRLRRDLDEVVDPYLDALAYSDDQRRPGRGPLKSATAG